MRQYVMWVGRCEVPGCTERWTGGQLDPHHVEKRSQGGCDDTFGPRRNIVVLCRKHHDMAESGALTIERGPLFQALESGGWLFRLRRSPEHTNTRSLLQTGSGGGKVEAGGEDNEGKR